VSLKYSPGVVNSLKYNPRTVKSMRTCGASAVTLLGVEFSCCVEV